MVTVNELVTCVSIVLGNADPSICPACDGNGDGDVNIADLVGGVGNLLTACPQPVDTETPEVTETPEATETPQATRTPTEAGTPTTTGTPTVTATPVDVAEPVAGSEAIVANVMAGVPSVATAVAAVAQAAALATGGGAGSSTCPLNGTIEVSGSIPLVSFQLLDCEFPTSIGSVVFNGEITSTTLELEAMLLDQGRSPTLIVRASLSGSVFTVAGGECGFISANLMVSGTISSETPGGEGATMTLNNTTILVGNITFIPPPNCFPARYVLTLVGRATLAPVALTPLSGSAGIAGPLAVFFEDLRVTQDVSGDPIRTELNGDIASDCFGGDSVTLTTVDPLLTPVGQGCPTAGTIDLLSESGVTAAIVHMSDGSVGSDNDADGEIDELFPTCFDPALFACPAGES